MAINIKIFGEISCLSILISNNDREYTDEVVKESTSMKLSCKLFNDGPWLPQSQGSFERTNWDTEACLLSWSIDKELTNWAIECYSVQYHKNTSLHRTPYKTYFGMDTKISLSTTLVPPKLLKKLITEESIKNTSEKLIPDNQIRSSIPLIIDGETLHTSQLITHHERCHSHYRQLTYFTSQLNTATGFSFRN